MSTQLAQKRDGYRFNCKVCGKFCKRAASKHYEYAWKCPDCGLKWDAGERTEAPPSSRQGYVKSSEDWE